MTAIYHITHIRNLPNILKDNGLWCDRLATQRGLAFVNIAHPHIKERRMQKQVPCAPGGCVADYVPFYFAPRSPMLYAIHRRNVAAYQEGQALILHLVSTVEAVQTAGIPFVFTDGHAEMDLSRFFTSLTALNQVDWDVMKSRYWNDTPQDGDRKRRRQAEFLVQRFFPFNLFHAIGVMNQTVADQVRALIPLEMPVPVIRLEPAWYY